MRITDTFIIQNLQVLSESKSDGLMKIRGTFQRADEENNNKRVYPKALLKREIEKLQEAINDQRLVGELDHPEYDSVKLKNVAHKITGLSMKGTEVIGEAVLLNTPAGQVAQSLIKGGVSIGISSRGMGTLTSMDEGRSQVNEDYKLVTFDLVADPSTKGAYPSLTESTIIKDIVTSTTKKIEGEDLLLLMLEEKFNSFKLDEWGTSPPEEKAPKEEPKEEPPKKKDPESQRPKKGRGARRLKQYDIDFGAPAPNNRGYKSIIDAYHKKHGTEPKPMSRRERRRNKRLLRKSGR